MIVKTYAGVTFDITLSPSIQTVAQLKSHIQKKYGCPKELQKICVLEHSTQNSKELKDESLLSRYSDTTIWMLVEMCGRYKRKITVKTYKDETFTVELSSLLQTIAEYKSCIEKEYSSEDKMYIYHDKRYIDELKYEDLLNLNPNQPVFISLKFVKQDGDFQIFIIHPGTRKKTTIRVTPKSYVFSIRMEYESPHTELFVYNGIRLRDDHTLQDYNIEKNSKIYCVHICSGGGGPLPIKIIVKMNDESIKLFDVTRSSTVRDIKRLIDAWKNIPVKNQSLTFKGQKLNDDETLENLSVKDGDVIQCFEHKPTFAGSVRVHTDTSDDTYHYLKSLNMSHSNLRHHVYYKIFHLVSTTFRCDWHHLANILLRKYMSDEEYERFIDRMGSCKERDSERIFEILQQWKMRETGDDRVLLNALRGLGDISYIETLLHHMKNMGKQIDIDPLSDEGLHNLSEDIGIEWQNIGFGLGMKKSRLEQLRDNDRDLKTVIAKMLIEWRDKESCSKEEKLEKLKGTLKVNGKAELTWLM